MQRQGRRQGQRPGSIGNRGVQRKGPGLGDDEALGVGELGGDAKLPLSGLDIAVEGDLVHRKTAWVVQMVQRRLQLGMAAAQALFASGGQSDGHIIARPKTLGMDAEGRRYPIVFVAVLAFQHQPRSDQLQ
jgi:hypothetical protein